MFHEVFFNLAYGQIFDLPFCREAEHCGRGRKRCGDCLSPTDKQGEFRRVRP